MMGDKDTIIPNQWTHTAHKIYSDFGANISFNTYAKFGHWVPD